MPSKSLATTEQVLTMLAETPRRLEALTADLAPDQLRTAPAPGDWSANDVLAHLRSCADMWGEAIVTILAEDAPTIRAINPRTWIRQTDYPNLEFGSSLAGFTAQRAELLAVLEPLPPAGWERAATVTGAGKRLERTVLFYARWLASHERPHVRQVRRIVEAVRVEQRASGSG